MKYCSLQHRTYFHHQSHPQLDFVFTVAQPLHSSWHCFSTHFSSILGTYRPGEFIFQCPIFLPFHTVHGILKARVLMWFAIPFSSGEGGPWSKHSDHVLSELSTMTHLSWMALLGMAHSCTE